MVSRRYESSIRGVPEAPQIEYFHSSHLRELEDEVCMYVMKLPVLLVIALVLASARATGSSSVNYVVRTVHERPTWAWGGVAAAAQEAGAGSDSAKLPMTWNPSMQEYLVGLNIGGNSVSMIADTGSDLSWVKGCKSITATAKCDSPVCTKILRPLFSLKCTGKGGPCGYSFQYGGDESAAGVFANQTVDLPGAGRLNGVLVGCTTNARGKRLESAGGVLGLAFSPFAFQHFTPFKWPETVIYCLNTNPNGANYLAFGAYPFTAAPNNANIPMTQLKTAPWLYAVRDAVFSLSSGTTKWASARGNLAFDLGTTITSLKDDVYTKLVQSLTTGSGPLSKLKSVGKRNIFDHCYAKTNQPPRFELAISFGRATFKPPVSSLLVDDGGALCLAIVNAGRSVEYSTLGSLMQRGHAWKFHVSKNTMSLSPSQCAA